MKTEKIQEILERQAIDNERNIYNAAISSFRKAIRISTSNAAVTMRIPLDRKKNLSGARVRIVEVSEDTEVAKDICEVKFYTDKFFECLIDSLLEARGDQIRTKAITDFLNKFDNFKQQIILLEQHIQE